MTFTTRIQPSTRRALEEAAKARPDGSISAAAEFILKAGLQRPSAVPRNNAIGAAIVLLAESIESATGFGWLDDQWTGMALRYAIEHLLFWYAPTPDDNFPVPVAINAAANKMPPEFAERFRKPAGFGHTMADRLIHEIQQATSPGPINEWSLPIFLSGRPAQLRLIGRDLGIAQTKKGRAK
jgi:hypothetical protein